MRPTFFTTRDEMLAWLERHHARATELWVGYYKRTSGTPSITWPESVDAALCFGWIDGVRKSLGASRYVIRFTPRRPGSIWSAVNIRRATELERDGLLRATGLAAFRARRDDRSAIYAYEQRKSATLAPAEARAFRANARAWKWFTAEAPSYQRIATFWVVSAKKDETRARRLATLIRDAAKGQRVGPLRVRKAEPKR